MVCPIWEKMDARGIISAVATSHVPCSPRLNIDTYTDVIIRPSDRVANKIAYFMGHGGQPPSTCALFALGVLRLAGVDDKVLLDPYKMGSACTDLQVVGTAHKASTWKPVGDFPLQKGDIWLIDSSGYNSHVGVCVGDPVPQSDGSFMIPTCEGGQAPTGADCLPFTRHWVKKADGHWYCGARYMWVHIDCTKLGIEDDGTDRLSDVYSVGPALEHEEVDENVGYQHAGLTPPA